MKRPGRFSLMLMLLPMAYLAAIILIGGRSLYLIEGGA